MVDEVFHRLGISVTLKINNRKILAGIAELIGAPDKLVDITVAIDKLDKIGLENVQSELSERGLSPEQILALNPVFELQGTPEQQISRLRTLFQNVEIGLKGVEELATLFALIRDASIRCKVDLDLTLARGLNYYTGAIFEVKANDVAMGSISGGGRYDNLTGIFGMPGLSGVGISFGADRIYDVLNQLDLYPKDAMTATQLLFINFGEKETAYVLPIANKARTSGIRTEIYPDSVKMKKQMSYANAKQIPFVALAGDNEIAEGKITLKNMITGEQTLVTPDELIATIA